VIKKHTLAAGTVSYCGQAQQEFLDGETAVRDISEFSELVRAATPKDDDGVYIAELTDREILTAIMRADTPVSTRAPSSVLDEVA